MKKSNWRLEYSLLALAVILATAVLPGTLRARNEPVRQSSSDGVLDGKAVKIKFEFTQNKIFLPVRIGKSRPLWFALDTDALSTVDQEDAKTLGLKIVATIPNPYRRGSAQCGVSSGVQVQVGTVQESFRNFFVCDLSPYSMDAGRQVDGILGADFARQFVIEIDYVGKAIKLYSSENHSLRQLGERILLSKTPNFYLAKIVLAGTTGISAAVNCFLDLGADYSRIPLAFSNLGENSNTVESFARVSKLQIGDFTIPDALVVFVNEPCRVGQLVLKHFKVTLDLAHDEMYLEPNSHFNFPDNYEMSGIVWHAQKPNFRSFKIWRIYPNTPAADSRLQVGDELIAINGKPASKFTIQKLWDKFSARGGTYELTIKRGTQVFEVKITLRKLV